jgi:hypothetical protein
LAKAQGAEDSSKSNLAATWLIVAKAFVDNPRATALGRAEVLRHILWREAAFTIGRCGLRFKGGRETAFACFDAWQQRDEWWRHT